MAPLARPASASRASAYGRSNEVDQRYEGPREPPADERRQGAPGRDGQARRDQYGLREILGHGCEQRRGQQRHHR